MKQVLVQEQDPREFLVQVIQDFESKKGNHLLNPRKLSKFKMVAEFSFNSFKPQQRTKMANEQYNKRKRDYYQKTKSWRYPQIQKWKKENREKCRAYEKKSKQKHKEKVKFRRRERRAMRRLFGEKI